MNRISRVLLGLSVAVLSFTLVDAPAQAQQPGCPVPFYVDAMNPPLEGDDCDYARAGYGAHGWYQRNFGSSFSAAGWPYNDHTVCSPFGFCYTRRYCKGHGRHCR